MTGGLLVGATGMLLTTRIGEGASYVTDVLPAVSVFGLGLSAVVAIPPLVGLTGEAYRDPATFNNGFQLAMVVSAALLVTGALLSFRTVRRDVLHIAPEPARPHTEPHTPRPPEGSGPPLRGDHALELPG